MIFRTPAFLVALSLGFSLLAFTQAQGQTEPQTEPPAKAQTQAQTQTQTQPETQAPTAQAAVTPTPSSAGLLTYERSWPQQKVPYFRIAIHPDGSGTYSTTPPSASGTIPGTEPDTASQPIQLSARDRDRIFAAIPAIRSPKGCDTGNKHVAQTGRKTFLLEGAVGTDPAAGTAPAQCVFNFSEDRRLEDAVATLNGIALTIEEATHLSYLLRFDRLGLDAALGSLLADAQAGRALEMGNIAPLLHKLQADDALMTRVRERAETLLTLGEPKI